MTPAYETPWPRPEPGACDFYHAMELPGLGAVPGTWDTRPDFDNYVGGLDWQGKAVLDVGTCSGFNAFELERRGAQLTAFDADGAARFIWVPFAGTRYHRDRADWNTRNEGGLRAYKNAFWFAWHALGSQARVVYGDIGRLAQLVPEQDVVLASAIIEHLADPVTAIGQFARLAREAVVIGFTPVEMTEQLRLTPLQPWNRDHPYVWWQASLGLYRQLFAQLGFEIELRPAFALFHGTRAERHTIIARRISPP